MRKNNTTECYNFNKIFAYLYSIKNEITAAEIQKCYFEVTQR